MLSEASGCGNVARQFFTLARRSIPGKSGIVPKRNCSISPVALLTVFVLLAAVSVGIGIGFAMVGAWLVLPFAGIEAIALGAAFVATARRMADYERIER
jgi:uncharacterized membrane protein